MSSNKLSAIFVASILAATQMSAQAQTGASAATSSAVGSVNSNVFFATAAVAFIAAASSGSSGAASVVTPPVTSIAVFNDAEYVFNDAIAVLTDDVEVYDTLKRQCYDGRDLTVSPWENQKIFRIGYHYRPTIEEAFRALELLPNIDQEPKPKQYPNLRELIIIK